MHSRLVLMLICSMMALRGSSRFSAHANGPPVAPPTSDGSGKPGAASPAASPATSPATSPAASPATSPAASPDASPAASPASPTPEGKNDTGSPATTTSAAATSDTSASSGGIYGGKVFQGQATTDNADWSIGNCLLQKWPQPKGLNPIAMAQNLWDNARICGACVSITSSYGTSLAIVTDQSDVHANSLDLGRAAWDIASNHMKSSAIPITWHVVPCNFSTPIQFINQAGTNPQWTAVQVAGSNIPIKSLEAMPTGKQGSWITLTRQSNSNHFSPPKGTTIGASADLRVTCESGKQFVTKNVNLVLQGRSIEATGNC